MNTTDATTISVSKVANVIIPVDDQDATLAFYTEKLGLEKRADVPFGDDEGNRWIEVAPRGAETPIAPARDQTQRRRTTHGSANRCDGVHLARRRDGGAGR